MFFFVNFQTSVNNAMCGDRNVECRYIEEQMKLGFLD